MIAPAAAESIDLGTPESPYKGLVPFEDSDLDALLFFGREDEREVIMANLLASRLTVLYGPSGVGKSSLLRAGVAHQLRREAERNLTEHGHPELAVATFGSWSDDPVAGIRAAAHASLGELFGAAALHEARPDEPLADVLERWTSTLGCELLLILDQAEEYFLYHERDDGSNSFAEQLPELVTRGGLRVGVLLAVREDSLAKLDFFKGRIPSLFANYLRLDHLDRASAQRAITGPLERFNELAEPGDEMTIEPALVEAVLDQVEAGKVLHGRRGRGAVRRQRRATSQVETPYLQLVMQRLWGAEAAEGSRTLRRETFDRLGGAAAIIEQHLERALSALTPAGRDVAASMFHHLVTPSGTKIAHRTADLAQYAHVPRDQVNDVVRTLAEERILRPVNGKATTDSSAHEIFHDVLGEAILAWRTKHDTESRVARERADAHRRQRRFLAIAAVALAGLAAMTLVAVYALAQRSDARENAALASEQRTKAVLQAALAETQRAKARREAQNALVQRREARRQATRAAQQEAKANQAAARAEDNEREALRNASIAAHAQEVAEQQTDLARSSAAAAQSAERRARHEARVATVERRNAVREARRASTQRRRAERQAQIARGRQYGAQALALVGSDPEQAVRLALRAAKLVPGESEDVLRLALRDLRVRGIFPGGGGAVLAAGLNPDASSIALAAEGGTVRFYRTRTGDLIGTGRHGARLRAAAVSADGRLIATAGRDRHLVVWDARGRAVRTLETARAANNVVFSLDGVLVAATTGDRAGVWNVATGERLLDISGLPPPIAGTAFSPDGRLLAVVANDRFAPVFEVPGGRRVASLEQQGVVVGAWFSPRGDLLVTGGRRNAYVWSTAGWSRRYLLEGHSRPIDDVAFSPDEERLVTVGDGIPRVWSLKNGDNLATLLGHRHEVNAAAVGPDQTIATASEDGTSRLWIGNPPVTLAGHADAVTDVSFSADARLVLTTGADGSARLWENRADPILRILGRHDGPTVAASYSPDGKLILGAGGTSARIWRAAGGLSSSLPHAGRVTHASFAGSAGLVLTASEDGSASVWRARDGVRLRVMNHGAPVRAAAATRDGRLIVTAGDDGVGRIWTNEGRPVHALRHGGRLLTAGFSNDGRLLVTGGTDRVARIWSVATGRLLRELEGHTAGIVAAAFDRRARRVVTASADSTARVWSAESGQLEFDPFEHEDPLTTIAFSPDGNLVLTATSGGDARTWSMRSGRVEKVFRGHVSVVAEARFSPDGRWVVTAGPSAAGIWQTRTGELLFFLRGHDSPLQAAAFAPDSRRVVTAGVDRTVRIYRCDLCAGVPGLRILANRRLRTVVHGEVREAG